MGDRCHRIGQTQQVIVYRLCTENSVELRMLQRANQRRKLERLVVSKGAFKKGAVNKKLSKEELSQLLQDDVDVTEKEDGGITSKELRNIMDRKLLVEVSDGGESKKGKKIPLRGSGYEI